jgi:hypothetical protein
VSILVGKEKEAEVIDGINIKRERSRISFGK